MWSCFLLVVLLSCITDLEIVMFSCGLVLQAKKSEDVQLHLFVSRQVHVLILAD
ncbi:hypothetical protein Bca4012_023938 [Brassica carinata]